jgi:hypothetical protein
MKKLLIILFLVPAFCTGQMSSARKLLLSQISSDTLPSCGSYYQGGILVYCDGNGGGLIAAPDAIGGLEWDASPDNISWRPRATYGTYGLGLSNTEYIVNTLGETRAKIENACLNYTNDGYDDWFMPSYYELEKLSNLNSGMWDYLKALLYYNITFYNEDEVWTSNDTQSNGETIDMATGVRTGRSKTHIDMYTIPCRYVTE